MVSYIREMENSYVERYAFFGLFGPREPKTEIEAGQHPLASYLNDKSIYHNDAGNYILDRQYDSLLHKFMESPFLRSYLHHRWIAGDKPKDENIGSLINEHAANVNVPENQLVAFHKSRPISDIHNSWQQISNPHENMPLTETNSIEPTFPTKQALAMIKMNPPPHWKLPEGYAREMLVSWYMSYYSRVDTEAK